MSLKAAAEAIPAPVGRRLARVPFSWRLGRTYSRTRAEIAAFEAMGPEQRREVVLDKVRAIVGHACGNVPFYASLYQRQGFAPDLLRTFDDIAGIPIVTKKDLQGWTLERRSHAERRRLRLNTGGTSGEPLTFYVDRSAFAREWAHMHHIWEHLGYRQTDLKLTFRGRNIPDAARYNAVHNEFLVSGYHPWDDVVDAVVRTAGRLPVRWVHGYPSAIYAFAKHCETERPDALSVVRSHLRGVLLGSEYPAPVYRELIERILGVPSLSWYGHSEMALLAAEQDTPFVFHPMHTYGLAEAVPGPEGHRLIGTSYANTASPLIRYDTGDLVAPVIDDGMLSAFRVTSGRLGEFVLDRSGRQISLTALVFGRHHPVFDTASFVQVRQSRPGHVTFIVTAHSGTAIDARDWEGAFDTSNVALTFDIEVRQAPIRTKQGKVPLLVPAP